LSHASTRPTPLGALEQALGEDEEERLGELRADLRLLVRGERVHVRSTAAVAFMEWSVPRTRCPVSAAVRAMEMLS